MTSNELIEEAIGISLEFPEHPDRKKMISTGQSLTPLIYNLVKLIRPKVVFEWGPGQSSHAFLLADPNIRLLSYEHDEDWTHKAISALQKEGTDLVKRFEVFTVSDKKLYIDTAFEKNTFEIVLVDGIHRSECLKTAEKITIPGGIILCHDWQSRDLWPAKECNLKYFGVHRDPIQPQELTAIFIK